MIDGFILLIILVFKERAIWFVCSFWFKVVPASDCGSEGLFLLTQNKK